MEIAKLAGLERRRQSHGMNSRSPQTFVRVDVAHASQNALIEQERFCAGAASTQFRGEFFFGGFERIEAEFAQSGFARTVGDNPHASEAANVGVAELAAVVEREKNVSVRDHRRFSGANDKLTRHSQMNQQRGAGLIGTCRLEVQQEKFSVSANGGDLAARQSLLHGGRIVDEIRLAQADTEKSSSGQDGSQAARNGFYLGEFRHGMDWTLAYRARMLTLTGRKANRRAEAPGRGRFVKKNLVVRGCGCASILLLKIQKTL